MQNSRNSNEQQDHDAIGWVTAGHKYALAARKLQETSTGPGNLLEHFLPIGFLYCHAVELCLKGLLLTGQPDVDVADFGHNLEALFDETNSCDLAGPLLRQVGTNTRARIKAEMRKQRDIQRGPIGQYGKWADAVLQLPSNGQIGDALPDSRKEVVWLDAHHSRSGESFRYLLNGRTRLPLLRVGTWEEITPFYVAYLACDEIDSAIRANWRREPR